MLNANPTAKLYLVNCKKCSTPVPANRHYAILCHNCKIISNRSSYKKHDLKRREAKIQKYKQSQNQKGLFVVGDSMPCCDCKKPITKTSPSNTRCAPCQIEKTKKRGAINEINRRKRNGLNVIQGDERQCIICNKKFVIGFGSGGHSKKACSQECNAKKQNENKKTRLSKLPSGIRYKKSNEWVSKKKNECPVFAMKYRIRSLYLSAIKRGGYTKRSRTYEALGCSWQEFKVHMEKQFTKNMNWENRDQWHIDHIIPISSAKTEEEVVSLSHFTNLRPMWASENIKKGAKQQYLI